MTQTKTKSKPLTINKATSQAAARVRAVMPGELITVNTSRSWDMANDRPILATAVTFPPRHPAAGVARAALLRMAGVLRADVNPVTGYMTIVREA